MSNPKDFADLHRITRARYEQRQQSFAKVVAEENQLRAELLRLDEMNRQTGLAAAQGNNMQAVGADVIWRGWLGRSKTALNLRLARVLAVKEHHLTEVRRAYGKVLVVEELQQQIRNRTRKAQYDGALDQAISQTLHQRLSDQ